MGERVIDNNIIVDEPTNVTRAIYNLSGISVDFDVVQKFILSEKNTRFYLDTKLNSSKEPGYCHDYLWLDTGFTDYNDNPILVCLHNNYGSFVGHYTGTIRELSGRVKNFNRKSAKDIEKNYSRFISKYQECVKERNTPHIYDVNEYLLAVTNGIEEEETIFSRALAGMEQLIYAPEPANEEVLEQQEVEENKADIIEFNQFEQEVTISLLVEQMEGMQEYIEKLLTHIENNEKESQEELDSLRAENAEYKRALMQMRSFVDSEENHAELSVDEKAIGHNLLSNNEKILILGATDIRVSEMRAIARDFSGFEKADLEFITDYEKIKSAASRVYSSSRFAAVIFGNMPHKVAGLADYTSMIDEFKNRMDCPFSVDARSKAGGLKITKQSFREALAQVIANLKGDRAA